MRSGTTTTPANTTATVQSNSSPKEQPSAPSSPPSDFEKKYGRKKPTRSDLITTLRAWQMFIENNPALVAELNKVPGAYAHWTSFPQCQAQTKMMLDAIDKE